MGLGSWVQRHMDLGKASNTKCCLSLSERQPIQAIYECAYTAYLHILHSISTEALISIVSTAQVSSAVADRAAASPTHREDRDSESSVSRVGFQCLRGHRP